MTRIFDDAEQEAVDTALTYARSYWRRGNEPESQQALHVLALAFERVVLQAHAPDDALPLPDEFHPRPWCRDCGPGYRLGDEGCRHGRDYQPADGETGVCRTCAQQIWWETGAIGHRERIGWSDRITRGGDSLVCFKAVGYRHVPMGAREAAIYQAGVTAGRSQ